MEILVKPKNALVKQYQTLLDMDDVRLTFTDEALCAVAKEAIERKSGARGLRSILENIMIEIMYDVPSTADLEEVVIDEDVVSRKRDALTVASKRESA